MKNWKKLLITVLGTLLLVCIVCLGIGANIASTPEYQATATARASAKQSIRTETVPATTFPSLPEGSPTTVAAVSTSTATPDPNFDQLLTKVAGEFYATLTASVPTATLTPTPTPVAKVGDQVYLIPFAQGRPPEYEAFMPAPSPYDFILSPIRYDIAKLFSTDSVDDCDELMTREADFIDFKFDQPRDVIRELVCGDQHYYLIKGTEEWDFWVPEQIVSAEMASPMGYRFFLCDYEEYGEIPNGLVHGIGDEITVRIQEQPVRILFEKVELPERGKQFTTVFTITNNGDQPIILNQAKDLDLMHDDFLPAYYKETHTKTAWVSPINPVDVQVLPGQNMPINFVWEWDDRILWEFYLTFNSQLDPSKTALITESTVIYLFDLGVEAKKAGLFQTTPTP